MIIATFLYAVATVDGKFYSSSNRPKMLHITTLFDILRWLYASWRLHINIYLRSTPQQNHSVFLFVGSVAKWLERWNCNAKAPRPTLTAIAVLFAVVLTINTSNFCK